MAQLGTPKIAGPIDGPTVEVSRQPVGNIGQPEDKIVTRKVRRDMPFLLDDDMMTVTNHDSRTVVFRWARKRYIVEPGETKFVIFQALVDALGDPRSVDNELVHYNDGQGNSGIVMRRYDEMTRLFARYGIEDERIDGGINQKTGARVDGLMDRTPRVSIETLDGVPVTFPGQRPDMLALPVPQVDELNLNRSVDKTAIDRVNAEKAELQEQVDRMEERLNALIAQREGTDGT